MKIGKHVEEALRYAYSGANYGIQQADKEIEQATIWFNRYKEDMENAQARRSDAMDQKLELRATMIKLGIDPEKV